MKLDVVMTSTHLGVRYRHTNDGVVPLYLSNHLFDWFGILSGDLSKGVARGAQLPPTNALAAVFANGPDGVLFEQGDPLTTPMGILAFAPRVPLAQRLLPDESADVLLWFRLPLEEWHPNAPPAPEQSEPREVRTLTMRVGAIEQGDPRQAHEHPNYRGLYRVSGGERRELCASVPLAVPVELRVRFDGFLRST